MLDLYHWEPSGASARVMICLDEKGIEYSSHYVDVLAFEQLRPDLLKLSEAGEVPILAHDGAAYTEASYICEYLDEAFAEWPLMPPDARGRWQVRVWQKYVDDGLSASVSELAWHAYGARALGAHAPRELSAAIERIPVQEKREVWKAAVAGLGKEQLARATERIEAAVKNVESTLARSQWLAGSAYSLADIALFSYFNYLPTLCSNLVNDAATQRTMSWLRAVAARPGVRAALARGRARDPYVIAAPGPEQIRWG